MKRFVSKEQRWVALLVGLTFSLMVVFETGNALFVLLVWAVGLVYFRIEEKPPRWLLRTPLRRWLRR